MKDTDKWRFQKTHKETNSVICNMYTISNSLIYVEEKEIK